MRQAQTTANSTDTGDTRAYYIQDAHVSEYESKDKEYRSTRVALFTSSLDAFEVSEITLNDGTRSRRLTFKNESGDDIELVLFESKEASSMNDTIDNEATQVTECASCGDQAPEYWYKEEVGYVCEDCGWVIAT